MTTTTDSAAPQLYYWVCPYCNERRGGDSRHTLLDDAHKVFVPKYCHKIVEKFENPELFSSGKYFLVFNRLDFLLQPPEKDVPIVEPIKVE
jgi:hypothetical protein